MTMTLVGICDHSSGQRQRFTKRHVGDSIAEEDCADIQRRKRCLQLFMASQLTWNSAMQSSLSSLLTNREEGKCR